jgi:hypothetical protein
MKIDARCVTLRGAQTRRTAQRTGINDRSTIVWFLVSVIGLVIWIAIAFWPARVAGRKGHSFIAYFLLSLLFFPLALIMAYLVEDRSSLSVA